MPSLLPHHTTVHRQGTTTPAPPRKGSTLIVRGSEQSTALQQLYETYADAGSAYCVMSRGSKGGRGGGGGLDLKLHLSPPAPASASSSSDEEWSSSSPSSCLSSEGEREREREPQQRDEHDGLDLLQWSDSPEATSMVLAACPRCLMYVMLSEADPRCPRCRSPVLLDFLHHAAARNRSSSNVSGGGREGDGHSRNSGAGRNRRA